MISTQSKVDCSGKTEQEKDQLHRHTYMQFIIMVGKRVNIPLGSIGNVGLLCKLLEEYIMQTSLFGE